MSREPVDNLKILSIIIPTLNEEKNLSSLLDSIKKQRNKNYEVIVADAGSKDETKKIAKNWGCKLVKGGLPAKGRNAGARIARGDLLLFLDADVILPKNFLKNTLKEFSGRNLKIASFFLVPFDSFFGKIFFNIFYNSPILLFEKILAHGAMGILVKKDIFKKSGGFDEQISLAEDHYFTRQACKLGQFGLIKSTKIYVSCRRFKKDGWLKTGLKYFLCELHLIFLGPDRSERFKYDFDHLKKS